MDNNERFEQGFEHRKEVLGAAYVEKSWAAADDFNRPMQKLVTEYCWGEIWGDETLSFKTRSIVNLAMLTAYAGFGVLRCAAGTWCVSRSERSDQGV